MQIGILRHVLNFMTEYDLFPKKGKTAYLGVSGGKDSMALAYLFFLMKKEKLIFSDIKIIHVNHGTRGKDNLKEEKLLKKVSNQYGFELFIEKLNMQKKCLKKKSDFEARARKKRYEVFFKHLKKGDRLYLAHHLDDSLEWSLMQMFKTSNWVSTLGIPLKNKQIIRPLLCLSKKQINQFVKKNRIEYLEDKSNFDVEFERNYLRFKIIPLIEKKFPQYLKNYTHRSKDLALETGHSLLLNKKKKAKEDGVFKNVKTIFSFEEKNGALILAQKNKNRDFSLYEKEIIDSIKVLSNTKRGRLREQVRRLVNAAKSFKFGPMSFSGGVDVYIIPGMLYFMNKGKMKNSQIPSVLKLKTIYKSLNTKMYSRKKDFNETSV